jgi:hypothetical protein
MVEARVMENRNYTHEEQRLDEILFSNVDALTKVQQIIRLGFDAEVADEIVERHQTGVQAPVYYERLDFADLDDSSDPANSKKSH